MMSNFETELLRLAKANLEAVIALKAERDEAMRAAKEVSDAYLRVRKLLGAWDTQPGGADRFEVTERAITKLLGRVAKAEPAESERDMRKLEEECAEYWAFISAIAHYFGCQDGVDMRGFILEELDKLKASAMRGEALARTVMADQISNDRAAVCAAELRGMKK